MTGHGPAAAKQGETESFTRENTARILRLACEAAGQDPHGAWLLRLGSNAVYRLQVPVVVRIARSPEDLPEARRGVEVARWLESVDYPAVRALDVEQPVIVEGLPVTFWAAVSDDGDDWASTAEIAHVIRRLHLLESPSGLDLPALDPFSRAEDRIRSATRLVEDDRNFLTVRLARLKAQWKELKPVLPRGVIHGDASVGNVLRDRGGIPTLMDLDGFAIGPREWDLVLTALYYEHFGWHTQQEYATFAREYGFDVMAWEGYPVMRDTRELLMVTWLAQKAGENAQVASEVWKRIGTLRDGGSRKDWKPW
ncbi:hypothetical protein Acsp03_27580 [Actinomadura sp. NBRC 104412]|uniref:phosphotransferase enzyme family protein n=1 Tax=unclassified Actinomadura TaxID=2626254 RepID=UPI0024A1A152|nr:aminoglycoside phosphotransferase family protein [Actinomadura sp. NBRC 104412]GLZ05292.1 hypothetical protein Acsp03_27580 [Actinomadura sp. NBRC 104412]